MPSRCTGYNVKRFNPSVHGRYFQSTFGRSPQAFVSPAPCLPRTPSQSMLMKMPSRPKGKSIRMRTPPTLIERGRGGAGETNAATQMQSKYPPCAVTQNFLSLLLSGLGIEVRNPIREVSVIFVFPAFSSHLWTPIFDRKSALAVQTQKKVVRSCFALLPHLLVRVQMHQR